MAAFSALEAVVGWLADMTRLPVSTYPPADSPSSPSEFVTVELTRGEVRDMVDHPEVAVQVWAPTEERCDAVANAVKVAALTYPPPPGIHSLRVEAGPYRFYDEETRCPRYQLVLAITSQLTKE